MGVLNITPDSFFDGALYLKPEVAVSRAFQMIEEGVDILDIGAESSRPGAAELSIETESELLGAFFSLFTSPENITLSVDTSRTRTASMALKHGVSIINDIYALRRDPDLASLIAGSPETRVILMHMQGTPATMQRRPEYDDVIDDILSFFDERITYAQSKGIQESQIMLDPGIGFGKSLEHNLLILKHIQSFKKFGLPLVVGHSRKSFIGTLLGQPDPKNRLTGSLAVSSYLCYKHVDVLRVHDVLETFQTRTMIEALTSDLILQKAL